MSMVGKSRASFSLGLLIAFLIIYCVPTPRYIQSAKALPIENAPEQNGHLVEWEVRENARENEEEKEDDSSIGTFRMAENKWITPTTLWANNVLKKPDYGERADGEWTLWNTTLSTKYSQL